jgi:predicted transcriptional regulator with HTH domain
VTRLGDNDVEIWQKAIRARYGRDIGYALERSPSRIKVLFCVYDNSSELSIYEVSKETGVDYANVKGIVTGEGGKYNKKRSLISLELLKSKRGVDGTDMYTLNDTGKSVVTILKGYLTIINGKVIRK